MERGRDDVTIWYAALALGVKPAALLEDEAED